MHVFPEDKWEILESEERRNREPPEKIVTILKKIKDRCIAFDIGAGTGYFTEVLAKHFKKVYAVERSEKLAKILHSKNIKNVGIIISEEPLEIDFKIDLVLFADSIHEISKIEEYAEWCKISKHVIIIDWKKDSPIGPPVSHRIEKEKVIKLFKNFKFEEYDLYPYHYTLFGISEEKY